MAPIEIRRAQIEDVAAITGIYNDAIATTTGTFDTEPKTLEARQAWFRAHGPRHPVLVALSRGQVVAWGALGPFSDRPAYDRTAEVHVYVGAADQGQGIGSALLRALVQEGGRAGLHALVARIAAGNDASLHVHEAAGFSSAGTLREVGTKFGRRLDVHLLEYLYAD